MLKLLRPAVLFLLFGCSFIMVPSARAWGCKGHQTVALIAESHLTPRARDAIFRILNAHPIDPTLPRYCVQSGLDAFADGSTWPDDIREVRPDTSSWHFIDIPRGAPKTNIAAYCPPDGCVTSALSAQVRVLRDRSATLPQKADAIRFIVHFVADIHQPLHAITNSDLGGNCVPVTFFGKTPAESTAGTGSFHPNLHSIWDADILERMTPGQSSSDVAKDLDAKFRSQISKWQSQAASFTAWAWQSHQLAETVVYGRLPRPLPVATPRPMTACVENGNAAERANLREIDENLGDDYQRAAAPAVREQLAKAGARLAALLNSIWQ